MINLIDFSKKLPFLTDFNIVNIIFDPFIDILIRFYSETDKFNWKLFKYNNKYVNFIKLNYKLTFKFVEI